MKKLTRLSTYFSLWIYFCSCSTFSSLKDHPIPPVEPTSCSPVSGIVACYSFSGGVNDDSGNNNTARLVGATPTADRYGNASSAYSFTGNSYIELPSNKFNSEEFTYAAWVKPSRLLQQGDVFTILNTGSEYGDHAMVLAKTSVLGWGMWSYLDNRGHSEFAYSGVLPTDTNQWYHVLASRSKDMLYIYVNGSLSASQKMSGKPFYEGNVRTLIGQRFDGSASFIGSIDEVKLYNRALNAQEAKQIYDMN